MADPDFVDGKDTTNLCNNCTSSTQYRQLNHEPFITCYLLPFSIFPFTHLFEIQEAAFKIQLGLLSAFGSFVFISHSIYTQHEMTLNIRIKKELKNVAYGKHKR